MTKEERQDAYRKAQEDLEQVFCSLGHIVGENELFYECEGEKTYNKVYAAGEHIRATIKALEKAIEADERASK